jgi:hypothetical protein
MTLQLSSTRRTISDGVSGEESVRWTIGLPGVSGKKRVIASSMRAAIFSSRSRACSSRACFSLRFCSRFCRASGRATTPSQYSGSVGISFPFLFSTLWDRERHPGSLTHLCFSQTPAKQRGPGSRLRAASLSAPRQGRGARNRGLARPTALFGSRRRTSRAAIATTLLRRDRWSTILAATEATERKRRVIDPSTA